MKQINVKGFASEFIVVFPEATDAQAFTGAMLDAGGPITERETRALALAFGGGVVDVLPEHVALALDLLDLLDTLDHASERPATIPSPAMVLDALDATHGPA